MFVHGWSKALKEMFGVKENMMVSVMPERFYSPYEAKEHKFNIVVRSRYE